MEKRLNSGFFDFVFRPVEGKELTSRKGFPTLVFIGVLFAVLAFSLFGSLGAPQAQAASLPEYQWHTFFGSTNTDFSNQVVKDSIGNIYLAGQSSADWKGPAGQEPKNAYSGGADIMVLKLDSAGGYLWHTFYGSALEDFASSLAVDQNGNVYVTGQSRDDGWLGPGGIVPKNSFSGGREIFVLKLDSNGGYLWHTFHGTGSFDQGYGIVVDGDGNSFVAGYSNENWGSPVHAHNMDSVPRQDIVVFKLDSNGILQWNTFWGASVPGSPGDQAVGVDYAYGITRDNSGNLYVTGISYNTWQGGNSNNIPPLHPHSYAGGGPTFFGNYDLVVLKLDSAGAYQWHTFYGASDLPRSTFDLGDYATMPVCDGSGNLYVSGYSYMTWQGDGDTAPLHPHSGDYDITVLKLNSAGAYQWHTFYGSAQADYGFGPVFDNQTGNYYLAASSQASWQGGAGVNPLHPHSGGFDLSVLKLSDAGAYQWHTFYGSSLNDQGYGLAQDGKNLIVVGAGAASWLGDGDTPPRHAHSGLLDSTVLKLLQKSISGTVVVSSRNPARLGNSVTFTATVSSGDPGVPTGSVIFRDGVTDLGTVALDAGAQATLDVSGLDVGSHSISAEYSGDGVFFGSTGLLTQVIAVKSGTTTVAISSKNPALPGESVTFTATVGSGDPGVPTGSVIFRDGAANLGTVTLDVAAQAALTPSPLTQGSHPISAEYGGDDSFSGSTGLLTQVMGPARLYLPLILNGI